VTAVEGDAPWYRDGLRFGCTQCGNCCGGAPGQVWISAHEINRFAAFLGLSTDQFTQRHTRRIGSRTSLLEKPNGDCEFLARDVGGKARCTVYEVRPRQCRTWPFWSTNLSSPQAWAAASRGCPGINSGPHHALPVIHSALVSNGNLPL
jgi:hypothetical protein